MKLDSILFVLFIWLLLLMIEVDNIIDPISWLIDL